MSSLNCLQENHEKYDIEFYYRDKQEWKLACFKCQFESSLSKDAFIPISNLEKWNQESLEILSNNDIQQQCYDSKSAIKQFISKFQISLEEIQKQVSEIEDQINNKLETILSFKITDLTYSNFKTAISTREIIRDEIALQKRLLQNVTNKLQQAYEILYGLETLKSFLKEVPKKEELIYKNPEVQQQQNSTLKSKVTSDDVKKVQSQTFQSDQRQQQQTPQANPPYQEKQNKSNVVYEGEYLNGKYHGQGILRDDEQVFTGEFKNGMKCGKGELVSLNGEYQFVGEFWNNQKHGHGETITIKYLDEECDLTQSIFFKLKNQQRNCIKIKQVGWYEFDKKNGVFEEERIENGNSKKRFIYYQNDQFINELND